MTVATDMQTQIDSINKKLDIVLEEIQYQRQRREQLEELVADLSIVGKDAFKATVETLDNAGIELDTDALTALLLKVVHNIGMLNDVFDMLESAHDFVQDAAPIVKQVGIDAARQIHELDKKGYFEFIRESVRVFDEIITNFPKEDIRLLADNIVTILETVKNMTQPEMLRSINNAVSIYQHMEMDNIPEYSMWKAFKEIRSPEMKKGMGFIITFLKNLSKADQISNN